MRKHHNLTFSRHTVNNKQQNDMTTKVSDSLLDKLAKLLRLANDKAATQGEVANAMAAAKALARRHDIDIASVDFQQTGNGGGGGGVQTTRDSTLGTRTKYWKPFHDPILIVLEKVFEVRVVRTGYRHRTNSQWVCTSISLVGTVQDVAIAKAIYPFLESMFPRVYREELNRGSFRDCRASMNGCYWGLANGIIDANKREEDNLQGEDRSKWAMVVATKQDAVDRKFEELYPKLKESRKTNKQVDPFAYMLGEKRGSKINLNQVC